MKKNENAFYTLIKYLRENVSLFFILVKLSISLGIDVNLSFER